MEKVYKSSERRDVFPLEFRRRYDIFDLQEGCYYECPPGWTVFNLRYGYHRLYYIVGGNAWYQDDERRVPLKEKHLYIFPSQSRRYSVTHDPRKPLRVLWVHFELHPDIVNELIEFNPAQDAQISLLVDLWMQSAALPQPGNEFSCIIMLMLHLLERKNQFVFADFCFAGIERYIADHLHEKLTVAALADHYGYDRAYFSRRFKESYTISPGEYLKTLRMSRAANMLACGVRIEQICSRLGYADPKVFSRAFKAHYSVSPSEYIKSHKMQP